MALGLTYCSSETSNASGNKVKQVPNEPKFKKEGELVFYASNRRDTLKTIDIELAENPLEIEQGLMFRRNMQEGQGMLFLMGKENLQSFWMRNTYISLDLLFINSEQKIVTIRPRNAPLNDTSIPSNYPASYVLELVAGFCEKYNIKEGDFISFSRIKGV